MLRRSTCVLIFVFDVRRHCPKIDDNTYLFTIYVRHNSVSSALFIMQRGLAVEGKAAPGVLMPFGTAVTCTACTSRSKVGVVTNSSSPCSTEEC